MPEASFLTTELQRKYTTQAKRRMMDFVAARDYSEPELRQKLRLYFERICRMQQVDFERDESLIENAIEVAIQHAFANKWLGDPKVLSEKLAAGLHQKNKGIDYINNYLESKGLPPVPQESELELEKASTLVKNRYSDFSDLNPEEREKQQARASRFLASRGFNPDIVRKVIYEKFGS